MRRTGAKAFNQDLSAWNARNVQGTAWTNIFTNTAIKDNDKERYLPNFVFPCCNAIYVTNDKGVTTTLTASPGIAVHNHFQCTSPLFETRHCTISTAW